MYLRHVHVYKMDLGEENDVVPFCVGYLRKTMYFILYCKTLLVLLGWCMVKVRDTFGALVRSTV